MAFQPEPWNYIKPNVNKLCNTQLHGILKDLALGFRLRFMTNKISDMTIYIYILGKSWKFCATEARISYLMMVYILFATL